jgi:hypothetical protein
VYNHLFPALIGYHVVQPGPFFSDPPWPNPRPSEFGGNAYLYGRVVQIHEVAYCELSFLGSSVVVALVSCVRLAAMVSC